MADKPSDPAADLIELKSYIDQFSGSAWHKSTDDAVRELTLLQQKAQAATAQVGQDMPDDVRLWAQGIERDVAKALDAAKALDPTLAGNHRDEPALVELTKRLDQISSNAEYAANGIKSMPSPSSPPPPPESVGDIDLSSSAAPPAPSGAPHGAPAPSTGLDDIEDFIETDAAKLVDAIGSGLPIVEPAIVPNFEPRYDPDQPTPIEPGMTPSPMSHPAPTPSHQVIQGSGQSMLPDLVPQPDATALPDLALEPDTTALAVETAYEEPGIWNPDPLVEPEHVPEPPLGDDLA